MNWFKKKVACLLGISIVPISTLLIARHLIPDENGDVIAQDGIRCREAGRRVIKNRVVTDAYVNFLTDQLQTETLEFGDFKYHDSGTGTGAEAAGNTGLGTPTGVARATGTQTEGASANIYKSVATITYDGSYAVTEHGLFSKSSGTTLMDRTKFTAIDVTNGQKIEFTFQITHSSGG